MDAICAGEGAQTFRGVHGSRRPHRLPPLPTGRSGQADTRRQTRPLLCGHHGRALGRPSSCHGLHAPPGRARRRARPSHRARTQDREARRHRQDQAAWAPARPIALWADRGAPDLSGKRRRRQTPCKAAAGNDRDRLPAARRGELHERPRRRCRPAPSADLVAGRRHRSRSSHPALPRPRSATRCRAPACRGQLHPGSARRGADLAGDVHPGRGRLPHHRPLGQRPGTAVRAGAHRRALPLSAQSAGAQPGHPGRSRAAHKGNFRGQPFPGRARPGTGPGTGTTGRERSALPAAGRKRHRPHHPPCPGRQHALRLSRQPHPAGLRAGGNDPPVRLRPVLPGTSAPDQNGPRLRPAPPRGLPRHLQSAAQGRRVHLGGEHPARAYRSATPANRSRSSRSPAT